MHLKFKHKLTGCTSPNYTAELLIPCGVEANILPNDHHWYTPQFSPCFFRKAYLRSALYQSFMIFPESSNTRRKVSQDITTAI